MGRIGKILQIDELIAAHWAGCDVLQGETPEEYAMRHEEALLYCGLDCGFSGYTVTYIRFVDGRIEILEIRPDDERRVKESQ